MYELSKQFRFEAAHTLHRDIAREGSRRIHGHSYRAEVFLRGAKDPQTGMMVDLGRLATGLALVRDALDHHFLDEVEGLGPATMENLAYFIWMKLKPDWPHLYRVSVYRDSEGDACSYYGAMQNVAEGL